MADLVLKKAIGVQGVFPEGGYGELAYLGVKIINKVARVPGFANQLFKLRHLAEKKVHTALLGGYCVPVVLRVYTDRVEIDPNIPSFLSGLYENIEMITIPANMIRSVRTGSEKIIYEVVDIMLDNGKFRLAFMAKIGGAGRVYDAIRSIAR
jgi:hypothetical protein